MAWKHIEISVLDLQLDENNPRVDGKQDSSQIDLRLMLLKYEKVTELSKSITESEGLLAGERIIILQDRGKNIVLEGNRRVCACQLLVNRDLIPEEYRKHYYYPISEKILNNITNIYADVAPSREAAEPIITRRHTEPGIESWSPVAKQRRIFRLYAAGTMIDEIANTFDMTKSNIIKSIKEYNIFNLVKDLKGWTKNERDELSNPKLKINPYTRFFTLKNVGTSLGISFDEYGTMVFKKDRALTEKAIQHIARCFLLKNEFSGKSKFNTRTEPEEVFRYLVSIDSSLLDLLNFNDERVGIDVEPPSRAHKPFSPLPVSAPIATIGTIIKPKIKKFFEEFYCPLENDQLIQISNEISSIDYKRLPIAAMFLIRALLERILNYCIDTFELRLELMKEFGLRYKTVQAGREPGLEFMYDFCIKNSTLIFKEKRAVDLLVHTKNVKNIADIVIHGKWVIPTQTSLEHAASLVRPLAENIVNGCFLKDKVDL